MSNLKLEVPSALYNERKHGKDGGTSSNQTMFQCREDVTSDNNLSIDQQPQVADCLESIEKDYVLVYRHVTSTENISYYLATSLQENSNVRVSVCGSAEKNDENSLAIAIPANKNPEVQESDLLKTQCNFGTSKELQGLSTLHPSTRLLLLRQYLQAVSEVVDEKYKAGQYQEAFSVELVVLAAWKKAVEISGSWLASTPTNESPESSDVHALPRPDKTDFDGPSSACKWAEQGFIYALDHAEKLSGHLRDLDAKAEMPDAMEIVDEYMGNKENAAVSYSKALLLFSFIVEEATSLALSPPFILTPGNRQRICSYMMNLQTHQSKFSI
ncbi:Serine/threonine-protein kinase ATG1a [Linum perenne]